MSSSKVVCELGDATITTNEIDILNRKTAWLNDAIITFYVEWCKLHSNRKDVVLIQPTVAFMLRLLPPEDMVASSTADGNPLVIAQGDQIRQVFVPINNAADPDAPRGSHWSLLVFDKDQNKLLHYDSSRGFNAAVAKETAACLVKVVAPASKPKFEETLAPQQENGYDCGIYVLMNIRKLLFSEFRDAIDNGAAQSFRKHLLELIERTTRS